MEAAVSTTSITIIPMLISLLPTPQLIPNQATPAAGIRKIEVPTQSGTPRSSFKMLPLPENERPSAQGINTTAINIRMDEAVAPDTVPPVRELHQCFLVLSVVSATYIMENRVGIPVTMNQNTSTGRPASLAEYAVPRQPNQYAAYDRKTTSA